MKTCYNCEKQTTGTLSPYSGNILCDACMRQEHTASHEAHPNPHLLCDACGEDTDELTQMVTWPTVHKPEGDFAPMVCQKCLDANANRTRLTAKQIEDLVEVGVNAACLAIQKQMGVDSGDAAGLFFTGDDDETIRRVLRAYIQYENESRPWPNDTRLWQREHGAEYAVPAEIDALCDDQKLVDQSWHNDECPSFHLPGYFGPDNYVVLWVGHPDDRQRETDSRFAVVTDFDGDNNTVCETDDVHEAIREIFRTGQVVKLSQEFSKVLRNWLNEEELLIVRHRNAKHLSAGKGDICATHDFCDANMAMLEAFQNLGIKDPSEISDDDSPERTEATELWNRAWDMSKAAEFKN